MKLTNALGGASSSARIGVVLVLVVALAWMALFNKDRIGSWLLSGETIEIEFDEAYKLRAHVSQVKVAYVVVGKVTGVEPRDGGAVVTVKVEDDVIDKLGSDPSATVRPTTLLGGSYFVDLQPGGDPGAFDAAVIPAERTDVPVELDKVARALQPDAIKGMQDTVGQLEDALDGDGQRALRRLMAETPEALEPTSEVLDALQGKREARDLTALVSGLENMGRELTAREGEFAGIIEDLATTSAVLDRRSADIAVALDHLPRALPATRRGLTDLEGTLDTLREVSADTRPVVTQLGRTLETARPVLKEARPLVADLRVLMADARPVLRDLVPTAVGADAVLDDLEGDVLDRTNADVLPWLRSDYAGKGPYSKTESDLPMYEEVGYMFSNVTRSSALLDSHGHAIAFQPGPGAGSIAGLPISLEQMFDVLSATNYPEEPVAGLRSTTGGELSPAEIETVLDALLGGDR